MTSFIALPWTAEERIPDPKHPLRHRLEILPVRSHLCPDVAGFPFQRYTYLSRFIVDILLSD
ncbi:MAG: hypothetical protein ACREV4_07535 [Gammaproteobacteria bacterium]